MDAQVPAPSQPPRPAGRFDFGEFLNFRYLITPAIITIVYVVGALLITLASLVAMAGGGSGAFVSGLLLLVFGNLYWRVVLEFVMVLFRMNDSLQAIERRGRAM